MYCIGKELDRQRSGDWYMTEEQAREVQEDDRSIVKMEDFTSPDELISGTGAARDQISSICGSSP